MGNPYDQRDYDTQLDPNEEPKFQAWKRRNAPKDSGADYDLRGAYKANLKRDPSNQHLSDRFKKPNHPTFSNESQYAPYGNPGRWGPGEENFIPAREDSPQGMSAHRPVKKKGFGLAR